jgi:hypothetical protein
MSSPADVASSSHPSQHPSRVGGCLRSLGSGPSRWARGPIGSPGLTQPGTCPLTLVTRGIILAPSDLDNPEIDGLAGHYPGSWFAGVMSHSERYSHPGPAPAVSRAFIDNRGPYETREPFLASGPRIVVVGPIDDRPLPRSPIIICGIVGPLWVACGAPSFVSLSLSLSLSLFN